MSEFQVVTQSYVSVTIISTQKDFGVEKRYAKDIKIADFKNKLELITGFASVDMKLKLLNKEKKFLCDLDDDERMLGFYPVEDGYFIEVNAGKSILIGEEDPDFKRYELTDEEYAKKKNTLKEFKMKNRLGKYSEQSQSLNEQKERLMKEKMEEEKKAIEAMKVGDRCQVSAPGAPTRLGTVMYLGSIENKQGCFVGVKYDEPMGKNDGSIDGKRYFECLPKYGGFLKPEHVTVGDFPEEDLDEI